MNYIQRLLSQRGISPALAVDDMRFLVTEKLGPNQSLTPEGFLLIRDTPVARCGWQLYAPQEIPDSGRFSPPPDGVFRVYRDEKEVFDGAALASSNGKPVIDEHPEQILTPDSIGDGAPGVALDPRRGTGVQEDLVVMDLMIFNKKLIGLIQGGKRELSLGYDVEYEEIEPGRLAQKNIRINHVALVDSGRCGAMCAIGDRASPGTGHRVDDHNRETPTATEVTMASRKKVSAFDRLRALLMKSTALSATDKEEFNKAIGEGEAEVEEDADPEHKIEVHNHMPAGGGGESVVAGDDPDAGGGDMEARVSALETAIHELAEMLQAGDLGGSATSDDYEDRFKKMEDSIEELKKAKPDGEDDAVGEGGKEVLGELELELPAGSENVKDVAAKMKDSALLVDSFRHTVALAEIIAPGIRIPAFDAAMKPGNGFKVICNLRRQALDFAKTEPAGYGLIEEIMSGRTYDSKTASCRDTRTLFNAVGTMKKSRNTAALRVGDGSPGLERRDINHPVGQVQNMTDLNKLYATAYKQ
jgi:hypothetical protein